MTLPTSGNFFLPLPATASSVLLPERCPRRAGSLTGVRLGPVRLGMTRAQARRQFVPGSLRRRRRYMDSFCSASTRIRVGYPSPRLLHSLPARLRHRYGGRVVIALTSSRRYALHGVRPGTRLATARRHLRIGRPYRVGANTWYLLSGRRSLGVVKVRRGIIGEVGIAATRFGRTRREARIFLSSFS